MVFITIMLPVVLLAGIFLYQAGKLTSEKMQVQNAADAVAFSISTLEARDLNFMAYTNRAMVANEVGVAQLVGLLSWADHWASTDEYMGRYADIIDNTCGLIPVPPVLAACRIIAGVVRVFGQVIGQAGGVLHRILAQVSRPAITALNFINRNGFGNAQRFYHGATIVLTFSTVAELIPQNAPGAKLSEFGTFALLGHVFTYATQFLQTYNPGSADQDDRSGFERFAAITRDSRDPFTTKREGLPTHLDIAPPCIPVPLIGDVCFRAGFGLETTGGSELRYVDDSLGGGNEGRGDDFNWSGVDITAAFAFALIELRGLGLPPIGLAGDIPFATGGAQVGDPHLGADAIATITEQDYYGGALDIWRFPVTRAPLAARFAAQSALWPTGDRYRGLPMYTDTTSPDPAEGALSFQAPFLLVGVVRDVNDPGGNALFGSPINDADTPQTAGELRLIDRDAFEEGADNEVGALAKSEVFFARPNDLDFFAREDGRTEYGSTFNPYWQAHLVDTGWLDRSAAMLVQQKQLWLPALQGLLQP